MTALNVSLVEGTQADKTIFRNLMHLYQYDMSEFNGEEPNPHGLFEYNYLDQYWTQGGKSEGRVPLLILVDGRVAGFVLKYRNSWLGRPDTEHFVAEFFVMRKWRQKGVGRRAVAELFRRFPGQWEVSQEPENKIAQQFWRKVIAQETGGRYTEVMAPPGWDGPVQLFRIPPIDE